MAEIAALRAELQVFQQKILKSFDSETLKRVCMSRIGWTSRSSSRACRLRPSHVLFLWFSRACL
jgi:hypothetical protein